MCVVSFCGYWIIGFSISWLAPYLRLSLAFDASKTGWIIAGIYTGQSIVLFVLSWLADAMLRWGMSPRIARSGVMSGCMLLSAIAFVGCAYIHQPLINIFLFMVGTALPTAALALSPAIIANLVPDGWRNQTVGVIMAGVTLSGFFAPVTTGFLVDWQRGSFSAAFLAIAAIALIGGVISLLYVDPARRCVER